MSVKFAYLGVISVLWFLLGCQGHPQAIFEATTDWGDEPVVCLSDSMTLHLLSKNTASSESIQWFYVRSSKTEFLKNISISTSESTQELLNIQAQVWHSDGSYWSLPAHAITHQRETEDGIAVSNTILHSFQIPNYQNGDIIRIQVSRLYKATEFLNSILLRKNFPILQSYNQIIWSKNSPAKIEFLNSENISAKDSTGVLGDNKFLVVKATNLSPLQSTLWPARAEEWFASIQISARPNWSAVGNYYLDYVGNSLHDSEIPSINAKLRKTIDQSVDSYFNYVRDHIRYHADENGMWAFVPRSANSIFSQGYGDCKETASLLFQLLKNNGIDAGLALVHSNPNGLQANRNYPSLGGFNHMIVWIKSSSGLHFLDPTAKRANSQNSWYALAGRNALILEKGKSYFYKIPFNAQFRNEIRTHNKILNPTTKSWLIEGTIELIGYSALMFEYQTKEDHLISSSTLLRRYLQDNFELESSKFSEQKTDSGTIMIHYTANVSDLFLNMDQGGFLLTAPSLFGGKSRYTTLDASGPKQLKPIIQTDTWTFPKEIADFNGKNTELPFTKYRWITNSKKIQREYTQDEYEFKNTSEQEFKQWRINFSQNARPTLWFN